MTLTQERIELFGGQESHYRSQQSRLEESHLMVDEILQ